jgi:hypothetical protein
MASAGASGKVTVEIQRSCINTENLCGKNTTGIHSDLCEVCGEQTVDLSTDCGEQTVDRSTLCGEQTVDRSSVCGEQAVDRSTVCGKQSVDRSTGSCWATCFLEGRVTTNLYPRTGRTNTSTDDRSVKLVAEFLAQNRRATCEEISQATGISPTSVFCILKKICRKGKFVPDGSLTA